MDSSRYRLAGALGTPGAAYTGAEGQHYTPSSKKVDISSQEIPFSQAECYAINTENFNKNETIPSQVQSLVVKDVPMPDYPGLASTTGPC